MLVTLTGEDELRGPMKHKFCDCHLLHVLMYVQAFLCYELISKRAKLNCH